MLLIFDFLPFKRIGWGHANVNNKANSSDHWKLTLILSKNFASLNASEISKGKNVGIRNLSNRASSGYFSSQHVPNIIVGCRKINRCGKVPSILLYTHVRTVHLLNFLMPEQTDDRLARTILSWCQFTKRLGHLKLRNICSSYTSSLVSCESRTRAPSFSLFWLNKSETTRSLLTCVTEVLSSAIARDKPISSCGFFVTSP